MVYDCKFINLKSPSFLKTVSTLHLGSELAGPGGLGEHLQRVHDAALVLQPDSAADHAAAREDHPKTADARIFVQKITGINKLAFY